MMRRFIKSFRGASVAAWGVAILLLALWVQSHARPLAIIYQFATAYDPSVAMTGLWFQSDGGALIIPLYKYVIFAPESPGFDVVYQFGDKWQARLDARPSWWKPVQMVPYAKQHHVMIISYVPLLLLSVLVLMAIYAIRKLHPRRRGFGVLPARASRARQTSG